MTAKRGPKRDAAPKRTTKRKAVAAPKTPTPKATGKLAPAVLAVPPAQANNTRPKPKSQRATAARGKRTGQAKAGPALPANNPVGRPTKYRSEFCEQIRELAREGLSKTEMAVELGISRQCWHDWAEAHAEFLDAIKEAEWIAQAWWERSGRMGVFMGKKFNQNAWRTQVFNRFHHEYRDRRHVEHEAGDGLAGLLRELDGATGRFR